MNFGEFLPPVPKPSDALVAWARTVRAGHALGIKSIPDTAIDGLTYKEQLELDEYAKQARTALGHLGNEIEQDTAYLILWRSTPWWRRIFGDVR